VSAALSSATSPTAAASSPTAAATSVPLTTAPLTEAVHQVQEKVKESLPVPARDLLGLNFLGISLFQYLLAFVVITAALVLRRVIIYMLKHYAEPDRAGAMRIDERIVKATSQPLGFAVVVVGVLIAVKILGFPTRVDFFATNLAISVLYVTAAWLLFNLTDVLTGYLQRIAQRTETRLDEQLVPIVRKALKVFVVIIAVLQVIDQMGGDVKGLLAGLGLGGLAFALAARDSIANIFGSIVILADRPFRVGDWIEAEGVEGTVEEIGFRSTRIRTFAKSLITVPNSVVANWAINNWSAMPLRRVKMTIGVSYEATPRQMEAAVEGIRDLLRNHPKVYRDFFLVYFTDFGESALEILLYYFTTTTVWAEYLAVRQEINLKVMHLLEELGLEIAYPTHTVYVRRSRPPEIPPKFRWEGGEGGD